jgi:hypothetical protein
MQLAGKYTGLFGSDIVDPRLQPQFDTASIQPEQLIASGKIPGNSRILNRAFKFGETNQSNIPGIAATQQDPSNSWAINAIEAGGRYLPHLGAAWLGINAGPIGGGMDTMDPAAAAMRQRMMRR